MDYQNHTVNTRLFEGRNGSEIKLGGQKFEYKVPFAYTGGCTSCDDRFNN